MRIEKREQGIESSEERGDGEKREDAIGKDNI
jgi:hypothetical protein